MKRKDVDDDTMTSRDALAASFVYDETMGAYEMADEVVANLRSLGYDITRSNDAERLPCKAFYGSIGVQWRCTLSDGHCGSHAYEEMET